jgi:hypothetical protein
VLLGTIIASHVLRVPYYTLSPGSVYPTEGLIEVDGTESYVDDAGNVGFTTISIKRDGRSLAPAGCAPCNGRSPGHQRRARPAFGPVQRT